MAVQPAHGAQSGRPPDGSELVFTPGGARAKKLVHIVRKNEMVTRESGRLGTRNAKSGKVTVFPPGRRADEWLAVPPPNWICFAEWDNSNGPLITDIQTSWLVPHPPQTPNSGQLLYIFNGLQDVGRSVIVQPVLQWGAGPNGGGAYWSVGSWMVDSSGNATASPVVAVQPGSTVTGFVRFLGQDASGYRYQCGFTGQPTTILPFPSHVPLTFAVQVLEAYSIYYCSDYPGDPSTRMGAIAISANGVNLQPAWQPTNRITDCNQHIGPVGNGSPGGYVDICYR